MPPPANRRGIGAWAYNVPCVLRFVVSRCCGCGSGRRGRAVEGFCERRPPSANFARTAPCE